MAETGFQNILLVLGVAAGGFSRYKLLCLTRRDSEIEDQSFSRQIVNVVFQVFDPGDESRAVRGGGASGLMGEIRTDVAVREDDFALIQSCLQPELGFEAITGVEEGAEVRIHRFESAKI